MPYSVIAGQIEKELGAPPEQLFSRFDPKPFASASIGQVHRARTDDGREVVVKVQYPGVDTSVDSDLAHLKVALRASGMVKVDRKALNAVFEEMRARLHEELDYCNEADNVRYFREFHKRHPFVVVPDVVGERSSQRVLTLVFEPGDHIRDLDAKGYSQEIRDKIGYNLFHVLGSQIFELQAVHADPNPANLAVRPDGSVVLYDFGCVKKIPDTTIRPYTALIRAAIDERYDEVDKRLMELGARHKNFPALPASFYKPWRDLFLTPYLGREPYAFGTSNLHQEALKLIPDFWKIVDHFMPPVELVFIDRAALGHYGNIKQIRSRCAFLPLLDQYLAQAEQRLGA